MLEIAYALKFRLYENVINKWKYSCVPFHEADRALSFKLLQLGKQVKYAPPCWTWVKISLGTRGDHGSL